MSAHSKLGKLTGYMYILIALLTLLTPTIVLGQKCSINRSYTDFAYLMRESTAPTDEYVAGTGPARYDVFDGNSPAYTFKFQMDKPAEKPVRADWELHAVLDFGVDTKTIEADMGSVG